jgi:hypothetical protein
MARASPYPRGRSPPRLDRPQCRAVVLARNRSPPNGAAALFRKDMKEHSALFAIVHPTHFKQIWPIRRNIIGWPPNITVTDRDADNIAGAFHRRGDEVGRRMVENEWLANNS